MVKLSDKISFGKYSGFTFQEILFKDPGYILWLDKKEIVEFPENIIDSAAHADSFSYDPTADEYDYAD